MTAPASCPPALRAECELHYVLALPAKSERADYLDRSERYDGKGHADALRAWVSEAWHAARDSRAPLPCRCEAARFGAASVHHEVNKTELGPSHVVPYEGSLRRVDGVDSGVGAQ